MKQKTSFFQRITKIHWIKAIFCLLLFGMLEGMAIFFQGFSFSDFAIMLGLCLVGITLSLTTFPFPWPLTALFSLMIPSGTFLLMESMTHIVWDSMEYDAILLNLAFYYLLFAALILITGRVRLSLVLETAFVMIAGVANYFVILFRSAPILPWDLLSIRTAMSVADNYTFSIDHLFAELAAGFILLFLLFSHLPAMRLSAITRKLPGKVSGPIIRLVLLLLLVIPSGIYINFLFQPDVADKTSLDDTLFTPKYMYRTNGFFVAFLMDLRFLQVQQPDNYSAEAAQTLLETYSANDSDLTALPEELPNIIVIMNEAFSDPSVLGEFETNVDYIPYVSALLDGAENTISGYLYSSVLGGNTADSEYEFLTGNTMAFLPAGSIPYQQYIHSEIPSIVEQFLELGYSTVAMHPYNASGWNRDKVYPWMGFERMLFYYDFQNKVKLRKYVDDASNYENILNIYNSTEDPIFIFNVTMQNHSGYGDAYDNFTPEVTAELKNTKSNKYLNNYLSLIKIADESIHNLLAELEKSDRPTIVVFFGDHQPNDYVINPIYKENGLDINNQSLEQQQKRQIVPFFIWANYDIEEASNLHISINYLSTLLFQTANLPLSNYQNFLSNLYHEIPVINAVGYLNPNLNCFYLKDADAKTEELLDQYRLLQYYNMFDSK